MKKYLTVLLCFFAAGVFAQTITFNKQYISPFTDAGMSVQQTIDGGYIIGGSDDSGGNSDLYLMKTNKTGDSIWSKRFGGAWYDNGYSACQTYDSGFIFTGSISLNSTNTSYDLLAVKTDSLGNQEWSKTFGAPGSWEYGYSVMQTADSGYIIAGSYGISPKKIYLIKLDPAGNLVWDNISKWVINGTGKSVKQTSDGGFIVCGQKSTGGNDDVFLIKTNQNGDSLWTEKFGGAAGDYSYSVTQTPDSGYVLCGSTRTGGLDYMYVIKTKKDGSLIWQKKYFTGTANSIAQTNDNCYIVSGSMLMKTDTSGTIKWYQPVNKTGNSVQQTNDNGFVYTGSRLNTSDNFDDIILVKIDNTPGVTMPVCAAASRCGAGSVTLTASGAPAGTAYEWFSSFSATTAVSTAQVYSPNVTQTDTFYVGIDSSGYHSNRLPVTVTVHPLPVPSLSGNDTICAGTTGNIYLTDAGMSNYIWTVSAGGAITAGGSATDSDAAITWNTAGAQSVKVNYTDANGCTATTASTFNVTVKPLPIPVISGPSHVCVASAGNVYATEGGKSNYVWTVPPSATITAGGTAADSSLTLTWSLNGTVSVCVNYTDINGCAAAAPACFNVTVDPYFPVGVSISANPAGAVCSGTSVDFTATPVNGGSSPSYQWLLNGVNTGSDNPVFTTTSLNNGDSVYCILTSNELCNTGNPATSNVIKMTVNPLPLPTMLLGSNNVCQNSAGNVYTTVPGMTNYSWNVTGGTITSGGQTTDNSATITWNTPGPQSVSVMYSNSNGCSPSAPDILNVTVNPLPNPTISGNFNVCVNSSGNTYTTEAGMTNYAWTIIGDITITAGGGATDNSVTLTVNSAGPHIICAGYDDANVCSAISCDTVYTNPPATASSNSPICDGSALNLSATGGTSYSWSGPNGFTSTDQNPVITGATLAAAGDYIVAVTSGSCTLSPQTTVIVNALPVPALNGNFNTCINSAGNIYTTDPGMTNYNWTVSPGLTISAGGGVTDNTVTLSVNSAGPHIICVEYTDAKGCTGMNCDTVYTNAAATASSNSPACNGSALNLFASGGTGYSWSGPDGFTSTVQNPIISGATTAAAGDYTVTVTSGSCTLTAQTSVIVNDLPVPAVTGSNSVCLNSSGNVYSAQPGMTNYIWTVTGGTITAGGNPADNTVTVTWNTPGSQTVCVNYTDGNGCTAAASVCFNVVVNTLPLPTITGASPVCNAASGVTYSTEPGMSDYIWNITGGTITSGAATNTITVTWNTAGAQNVSVNYTDANGCTAASATVFNVTVNPLPVSALTGTFAACRYDTLNYYTDAGMTNYIWTVTGGLIWSGQGTDFITVNWNSSGTNSVCVSYTDANGCSPSIPVCQSVTVNPLPVPTVSGPSTACANYSGNIYTTEAGMSNYTWTIGGGVINSGQNTNTVSVTWTTGGSQLICVNYTDANGCTALVPGCHNVIVNSSPVSYISGAASACINSTGNVYTSQAGMTNYVWTVTGGTVTSGGSTGDNFATVTWNTTGIQKICLNYTDGNGCTGVAPYCYDVTVSTLPAPVITGADTSCVCPGNIYCTQSGMTNYVWTVPCGTITSGLGTNCITVTWNNPGDCNVCVNYTDANGCSAASPACFNVYINSNGNVYAGPNQTVCAGAGVVLNATGAVSYNWDNGVTNGVVFVPTTTTLYTVTATDANGYTSTDDVLITVNPKPNVDAGQNQTVCAGSEVTLTATGGVIFAWNNGIMNGIPFYPISTKLYMVVVTDTNGCSAMDTVRVFVNPLPVPAITGIDTVCTGTSVSFCTDPGMTGYVWTIADGTIISGQGTNCIDVSWANAVQDTICVNYTDANGCAAASPACLNLVVNTMPVPIITGADTICTSAGNSYCTDAGMTGYVWTISSGGVITTGQGTECISVDWTTAGAHSLCVVYTAQNGCSPAPRCYNVSVYSGQVVGVSISSNPSDTVCTGDAVTFTAIPANGGTSPSYQWQLNGSNAGTNSPVFTPSSIADGDEVVCILTSNEPCVTGNPASSNTVIMTVNPVLPVSVSITANPTGAVCAGTKITFAATATNGGISPAYQWKVNGINSGTDSSEFTSTTLLNGSIVNCVLTSSEACTSGSPAVSNAITITVNPAPATPPAASNSPVCLNSVIKLYASAISGVTYFWSGPDGFTSSLQNPVIDSATMAMNGQYCVYASANGCQSQQACTTVQVDSCIGIAENFTENNLLYMYPNPASFLLNIELITQGTKKEGKFLVYDQLGQALLNGVFMNEKFAVNIKTLAKGFYFLKVEHEEGFVVRKFVKE